MAESPVNTITRYDVHDLLDSVVDAGRPIMANRVLAVVRRMCNWAVERGIIAASPCVGVRKPTKETSRDHVLTDEELANVLRAADQLGGSFGTMVTLLVLSGQRRDEVAGMRWSEIDLANGLWRLPSERVKNGRAHDVPLSWAVLDVLEALPRIANSDFVLNAAAGVNVPLFVFQEGDDPNAEKVFRELARLSKGQYFKFTAGAARDVADLLREIAVYAAGGLKALENRNTDSARKLLGQLKK